MLFRQRPPRAMSPVSQSLPNQVNDFNFFDPACGETPDLDVAIPSKPGQRLQFDPACGETPDLEGVAIPSKPGQRLQ